MLLSRNSRKIKAKPRVLLLSATPGRVMALIESILLAGKLWQNISPESGREPLRPSPKMPCGC
jgi:hypothetical protein